MASSTPTRISPHGPDTQSQGFLSRGGPWVVGQMLILALIFLVAPLTSLPANEQGILHPLLKIAGCGLLVLGGGVAAIGALALGRHLTPFPSHGNSAPLQTGSMFRFVRHPLYLSLLLAATGWMLLWSSLATAPLVLALAFVLRAKSRREEKILLARFPEYADYMRRVPGFFPKLSWRQVPDGRESQKS